MTSYFASTTHATMICINYLILLLLLLLLSLSITLSDLTLSVGHQHSIQQSPNASMEIFGNCGAHGKWPVNIFFCFVYQEEVRECSLLFNVLT